MNVEFYVGIDERLDVPGRHPGRPSTWSTWPACKVLVADDVADTGYTLKLVREVLAQHVAEARTAVLYRKPTSIVDPSLLLEGHRPVDRLPWSASRRSTSAGVEKP